MHLFVIPPWISQVIWVTATALAYWRGGWRERALGTYMVLMFAAYSACAAAHCGLAGRGSALSTSIRTNLVTDSILLGLCLVCAWRSNRYWAIGASSIAVLYIVTDVLALTHSLSPWAYYSAIVIWNYAIVAALLWGVWSYDGRRRRVQKR